MQQSKRLSVALLVLVVLGGPTLAEGPDPADRIDEYLQPFVDIGHLSGSLLVLRGDETVYEASFGLTNRELAVPVTPETRFCIASITKPMTQIAALGLLQAGAVRLDDPISTWIDDFPRGDEITVEMLARHQAGIPHRLTDPAQEAVPRSAAEMVELARRAELDFSPGETTSYSSGSYSVLARVLELASGRSYAELLEQHVFAPVGMGASGHPVGYELVPNRASSYQFSSAGDLVNTPLKHYSFLVGAGSVFSTPRDLARLARGVVDGTYGELVRQQILGEAGIRWAGRTNGYQAFADYRPDTDIYLLFAGNVASGAVGWLRRDLPRLVAGEAVEPPQPPAFEAVTVPVEVLERYTGTYALGSSQPLEMRVEAGKPIIGDWFLIPTSETTFFSPQDYGEVTVVLGDDGRPERLDWAIGDTVHPMPRIEP